MSCKHGNWEPCEECEAEDAIYKSGFSEGAASVMKEIREKGTVVEAFLQQEMDNVHVIKAEVLQAQEPSPASDQPLRYATDLAIYLAKKFYPDVTQWRPLDDLVGVLTQIDNMVAGVAVERDALQAKIAEQSAEIEAGAQIMEQHCTKVRAQGATIAQQAERIAIMTKAYEDQVAAHNKTLDVVAQQAVLIEKCETAMKNHGAAYLGHQPECDEALSAIAAHKS